MIRGFRRSKDAAVLYQRRVLLLEELRKYGVVEVITPRNRGIVFVTFGSAEQANRALAELASVYHICRAKLRRVQSGWP